MKQPHRSNSFAFGQTPASGLIEWEELPSLADSLARRLVVLGQRGGSRADFAESSAFHSGWDNTMPAKLEPLGEPEPFRETMPGLSTRELREPDVFRHFFA